MSRAAREVVADWLMVAGAVLLGVALFLPWSHQFSPGYAAAFRAAGALRGIPSSPNAWQVYSTTDILLALLAAAVFSLAMFGPRRPRIIVLGLTLLAAIFVIHALSVPPTNGAGMVTPLSTTSAAAPVRADHPASGAGEILALVALLICAGGLALSLTAD